MLATSGKIIHTCSMEVDLEPGRYFAWHHHVKLPVVGFQAEEIAPGVVTGGLTDEFATNARLLSLN